MPRVVFEADVKSSARRVRIVEVERVDPKNGQAVKHYTLERSGGRDAMGNRAWEDMLPERFNDWDSSPMRVVVQELGRRCAADSAEQK